jgi:hypothetical protein
MSDFQRSSKILLCDFLSLKIKHSKNYNIFDLIDQNLLKQFLKLLAWFIPATKSFFKALYAKIIFKNKIIYFEKKLILFCSLNPLHLLDFKSNLKQTEVFRQADVSGTPKTTTQQVKN